ncbi:MAG: type I-C CRISPR-associated protein Cas7/Csd2 [Alphaproteobacteria bacterium]
MSTPLSNRYEFVYLFDVELGNPNGDPDAGNMPRLDYQTNHGLVTDVCLKRKVRNYVDLVRDDLGRPEQLGIYIRERGVLNEEHRKAYKALDQKPEPKKLPKDRDKAKALTDWMCGRYFDIRMFGAVMTTEVNCGQVRGPVQLAFARSVEPILVQEIAITRMAVTNEKDAETKEREMGRKHVVPYGLYRAEGYVSAHLANQTGFGEDDLSLFWQALACMFDHDHSAARGKMSARRLIVFKHASKLGNAPAHRLFEAVSVQRRDNDPERPARAFADYRIDIDRAAIPDGVEVIDML